MTYILSAVPIFAVIVVIVVIAVVTTDDWVHPEKYTRVQHIPILVHGWYHKVDPGTFKAI